MILTLRYNNEYFFESYRNCPRYLVYRENGITPVEGWSLSQKVLNYMLENGLAETLLATNRPAFSAARNGFLYSASGLISLPVLLHYGQQAAKANQQPFWYDAFRVADALDRLDKEGGQLNYISLSTFHVGGKTFRPGHKSYHIRKIEGRYSYDFKPFPSIHVEHISASSLPDIPARPICDNCSYLTICDMVNRDRLNLDDVRERYECE